MLRRSAKASMKSLASITICALSLMQFFMIPKMDAFARYYNFSLPPIHPLAKRYAFDAGCIGNWFFSVHRILLSCSLSKVFFSIVEAITINVVNIKAIYISKNKPMQIKHFLLGPRPYHLICVDRSSISSSCPIKFLHQCNVIDVNNGIKPLRKWDICNVAFNADWSYLLRHLAGSFRWYGPVEAATSRPATIPHFAMGDKA